MDLAEDLILDRGFNAFSYSTISSALGMRNAAVHYHFPSKSDLGVAVVHRARERFLDWTRQLEASGAGPTERLDAFFRRYMRYLERGRRVCLGGSLETDFKTLPEPMQVEARAFVSAILMWWESLLEEGRRCGAFSFPGEACDQAVVVMSTLQGALQTSRVVEPPCLPAAMEQIRHMMVAR
jgi:AcrR family transcriptional regulator